MSIATVQAVIDGQTYPLTLSDDGYYTLKGTAPALSSANEPGATMACKLSPPMRRVMRPRSTRRTGRGESSCD